MPTYEIEIKLFGHLAKANKREFIDAHRDAVLEQMNKAVNVTYYNVITHTPVGVTHRLRHSIEKSVTNTARTIYGKVFVREGEARKYAVHVEHGRRKGRKMPPKGALVLWMIARWGMTWDEAIKKEWGLRRSISEKGIAPALMFFQGLNDSYSTVINLF